ncbi:hypothetical protein D3C76_1523630 [compost metagenome]
MAAYHIAVAIDQQCRQALGLDPAGHQQGSIACDGIGIYVTDEIHRRDQRLDKVLQVALQFRQSCRFLAFGGHGNAALQQCKEITTVVVTGYVIDGKRAAQERFSFAGRRAAAPYAWH